MNYYQTAVQLLQSHDPMALAAVPVAAIVAWFVLGWFGVGVVLGATATLYAAGKV